MVSEGHDVPVVPSKARNDMGFSPTRASESLPSLIDDFSVLIFSHTTHKELRGYEVRIQSGKRMIASVADFW
jgi:hypothetical protein